MSDETPEQKIEALEKQVSTLDRVVGGLLAALGMSLRINGENVDSSLNTGASPEAHGILTKCWVMIQKHEQQLNDKKVVLASGVGLGINRRN